MPTHYMNKTTAVPEIPDAANPPMNMGTPLEREPLLITSKRARKKFDARKRLYEELTGEIVNI